MDGEHVHTNGSPWIWHGLPCRASRTMCVLLLKPGNPYRKTPKGVLIIHKKFNCCVIWTNDDRRRKGLGIWEKQQSNVWDLIRCRCRLHHGARAWANSKCKPRITTTDYAGKEVNSIEARPRPLQSQAARPPAHSRQQHYTGYWILWLPRDDSHESIVLTRQ